jgi:hypothetical protein
MNIKSEGLTGLARTLTRASLSFSCFMVFEIVNKNREFSLLTPIG